LRFLAFLVFPFGTTFLCRLPEVKFAEITRASTTYSEYTINRPRAGKASRGRCVLKVKLTIAGLAELLLLLVSA